MLRTTPLTPLAPLVGLVGIVALGGCGNESVTTYDAPRANQPAATATATDRDPPAYAETAPADTGAAPYGDAAAEPAAGLNPESPWVLPDGWSESPSRPPMRHATLLIPASDGGGDIEVAITRFPGDVGGMLANVNRWRTQVGLPETTEAELPSLLERFENPGFDGATLHLRGPRGDMLVASIHERAVDRTWFVRVIADPATIDGVKDEVFAFARTFGRTE